MPKVLGYYNLFVTLREQPVYMMLNTRLMFFVLLFCVNSTWAFAQDKFNLIGGGKSQSLSFKLINNVIIIPVEVNGSRLNFLLDTGVDNTIMFNLSIEDSLKLKNTQKIRIRGLGKGDHIDAIKSDRNFFGIENIRNPNHSVYLIPGEDFDLSASMGISINGIIGGDLFRDFVVDINYSTKRLRFFKPNTYKYRKCKKCQFFDLEFYKNKPYMFIEVHSEVGDSIDAKLLIDLGGSDALWLFDKSSEKINIPERHFDDYLGKGLSGNIYGKRSKIDKIALGNYIFTSANVAYPDSAFIETAYKHLERNGTLGSEILKRFRIIFDYQNKQLVFKNPSSYFNDPFLYNMSGIELVHNGSMVVPERQSSILKTGDQDDSPNSTVEILFSYVYSLKPSYVIAVLREGSPAHRAGLKEGDILLKLNGKSTYNYKLEEIIHIFSTKPGKQIRLLIERDGVPLLFRFELEKILE
tara:strand:- start:20228 stop:21628 length:1401 start_codon:yes stop_codon:yes gene_type:complete